MPYAVVHVLFTIIALDLFRDHFLKDRRVIPLHYIFIGGIAGLLPDIDIPLFWLVKSLLGFDVLFFHRTITHTFLFIGLFLIISLVYAKLNRKASRLFLIISFGVAFHIFLDWLLVGQVAPLYPLLYTTYGLDLAAKANLPLAMEGMEAIVLLWWLWHEEKLHRISDFI